VLTNNDLGLIARFLRVLKLDMAKPRLSATLTLTNHFHDQGKGIQIGLVNLAIPDIDNALKDIADTPVVPPLYPVAVDRIGRAQNEIAAALAATMFAVRAGHLSNGVSLVENARDNSVRISRTTRAREISCSEGFATLKTPMTRGRAERPDALSGRASSPVESGRCSPPFSVFTGPTQMMHFAMGLPRGDPTEFAGPGAPNRVVCAASAGNARTP
jgi:hypothetical protein